MRIRQAADSADAYTHFERGYSVSCFAVSMIPFTVAIFAAPATSTAPEWGATGRCYPALSPRAYVRRHANPENMVA